LWLTIAETLELQGGVYRKSRKGVVKFSFLFRFLFFLSVENTREIVVVPARSSDVIYHLHAGIYKIRFVLYNKKSALQEM